MRPTRGVLLAAALSAAHLLPAAERPAPSLPERLGYPADSRLVIVHADDVGVTHSVNAATIRALETGLVTSASLMPATPWFPEIAAYAREHPDADLGLHLALTSERTFYRWSSVASHDRVPSLLDAQGYLHKDWSDATPIVASEVEIELRAQVDRALALGVKPTHLDSHQNRLYQTSAPLFEAFRRVARSYGIPMMLPREWFSTWSYLGEGIAPGEIVIDRIVTMTPDVPPDRWAAFYDDAVASLQPGVTEFVIHVAYDNGEMQAFSQDRPTWGAAWRQRDFDYFTSDAFRQKLRARGAILVSWREMAAKLR
jgi:chitin disaccharide deacetylase